MAQPGGTLTAGRLSWPRRGRQHWGGGRGQGWGAYEEAYGRPELYWGAELNELCPRALAHLGADSAAGLRAIDLGCGEGRDAIHLALHGLEVTGVDLSPAGLAKARRWAAAAGASIRTVEADLNAYRLDDAPYDLVHASGSLTFLAPERRHDAFADYRRATHPGGLNAFNVFVEKPYLAPPPDWGAGERFFRSGELLTHYWDWDIVAFTETTFDCTSGGVPHRHAMDVLIARKVRD